MRLLVLMTTLALALTAGGCVSKKSFDAKALEASQLDRSLQELVATHSRLQQDADQLRDLNSDLDRQLLAMTNRSEALDADLQRSRHDIERLETVLSERSSEAGAAMAEMRQTIDRIETENRELIAQVEMERVAREARVAHLQSTYDELMDKMQGEISRGEVTISELKGKLTVNLVERILFDSGKADLKPAGLEILKRVGDILRQETDKEVRVEGHTDNVPVSPRLQDTFPSNWELSTARASNVVRFLQDRVGIPGERLSSCGFGQFRPIADNTTAAGRAENRRIQIVLVPLEAQTVASPE